MFTSGMTPEHLKAWRDRRLDCLCLECGATSAATEWCSQCGSRRLRYATHAEQNDLVGSYWCGGTKPSAERREAFATSRTVLSGKAEAAPLSIGESVAMRLGL